MKSSESIALLSEALVKANLVLTNPTKDRTAKIPKKAGGSYSYTYVDLASIFDDVRPILHTHGLAVVQEAAAAECGVGVSTRLIHQSGEWLEFDALVMPAGGDAQAIGSAITYARRYALCAALGIAADEDDDGKSSGGGVGGSSPSPDPSPQQGGVVETRPAAASHVHDWANSPNPKLTKFLICTVEGCLETKRREA